MSQVNPIPFMGGMTEISGFESGLSTENLCEMIRLITERQLRLLCTEIERLTASHVFQVDHLEGFSVEVIQDIVKSCFSTPEAFITEGAGIVLVDEEDQNVGAISLTVDRGITEIQSELVLALSITVEDKKIYDGVIGLRELEQAEDIAQGIAQDITMSAS